MKNSNLSCVLALLVPSAFAQYGILSTPAVHTQMSKLYCAALQSYFGFSAHEQSFTIREDGLPNEIYSSNDFRHNFLDVAVSKDRAIVHTHPAFALPTPSPDDVKVAVRLDIPNYVLSRFALWVALPDSTTRKVADVQWKHGELVLK